MSNEVVETDLDMEGAAVLLSADPLIISTVSGGSDPLGLTENLSRLCANRPAVFLPIIAWDCENEEAASVRAKMARRFRAQRPTHEVIFLANTPKEAEFLRGAGAEAFFANHNVFASEEIFEPIPGTTVVFDAVYNARAVAIKRHEIAADIASVAYVALTGGHLQAQQREIIAKLLALAPRHVLVNDVEDGLPKWMPPARVNEVLAQAAVGLCLSEVEGAMYASIEYMLAGLPIVSTPSRGGRDVFFDPDYCIIAEPDPRAIREAVETLRDRNIPREYIRARTLAKLEPERRRFLTFLEGIKERYGVPRSYATAWPFSGSPFHNWATVREHARQLFESPNPAQRTRRVATGPTTGLTAYSLHSFAPRLTPAQAQRNWMDRLPGQQAYNCLPMAIANAYGWDVLCPVPIEIEWSGGSTVHDLTIRGLKPLPGGGPIRYFCSSHFGSGIATMQLDYIFRTDPGWNLLATGPFNSPKVNAYPLSGIVDTDRLPFPLTMNWKILCPGRVTFEEDEPICAIFPIRMEAVVDCTPEIRPLADNPELKREYEAFRAAKGR